MQFKKIVLPTHSSEIFQTLSESIMAILFVECYKYVIIINELLSFNLN